MHCQRMLHAFYLWVSAAINHADHHATGKWVTTFYLSYRSRGVHWHLSYKPVINLLKLYRDKTEWLLTYFESFFPAYPESSSGQETSNSLSSEMVNPSFWNQLTHNSIYPWETSLALDKLYYWDHYFHMHQTLWINSYLLYNYQWNTKWAFPRKHDIFTREDSMISSHAKITWPPLL